MIKTRCSRLPLVEACPQSQVEPVVQIDTSGAEADTGTACHFGFAEAVALGNKAGSQYPLNVNAIAHTYRVDAEELGVLLATTWKLWLRIRAQFPDPIIEKPLAYNGAAFTLTGKPDLRAQFGHEIRILDLKTGRVDVDPSAQLAGYAFLALQESDAESVYACQLRPRDGQLEGWRWTRDEVVWRIDQIMLAAGVGSYKPGRHCAYCPRWHECPAALSMTRAAIQLATGEISTDLTPAQALNLHAFRKTADRASEFIQVVLRNHVAKAGGEVWDGEDGLVIETRKLRKIDFETGEAVLREELGARMPEAVSVSKTKAERIMKDGAGRGAKTYAAKRLMDKLEAAGAVSVEEQERLELKRRRIGITNESEVA